VQQRERDGALQAPDSHAFLAELQKTYVMTDQHAVHAGGKVAQTAQTEITFF